MRRNQLITVYHDPLTEKSIEGVAVLYRRLSEDGLVNGKEGNQFWLVMFPSDKMLVERWVHPKNLLHTNVQPKES